MIKLEKGKILCPTCKGQRKIDGFRCGTCDGIGQIPDARRWMCERCGAVHHFAARECSRCDSKYIREMDSTMFGGVDVGDIGWVARRLSRLVDIYSMPAEQVVEHPKMLKEAGIEDERLTPAIIHEANRLDREMWELIKARAARIRAMIDPKPHPATVSSNSSAPAVSDKVPGKRSKIFDWPVTAVIRWMGKRDWTFKDAVKVLKKLGVDIANSTVKIQLRAGNIGDKSRGEPAKLTKTQRIELKKMRRD